VQDAATPDAPATPTDTGGIMTIIISALWYWTVRDVGLEFRSFERRASDANPALIDDLSTHLHHSLFG
jgi:hypothetical protein